MVAYFGLTMKVNATIFIFGGRIAGVGVKNHDYAGK